MNQPLHARVAAMTFLFTIGFPPLLVGVQFLSGRDEFHFPVLQFGVAWILGIVLAITLLMLRLVLNLINGAHCIVRGASPSVAVGNLQGGRWTKDWCGGDQQWRPRLSGRGWTDRRRSG
jgi:hypothetical protein